MTYGAIKDFGWMVIAIIISVYLCLCLFINGPSAPRTDLNNLIL